MVREKLLRDRLYRKDSVAVLRSGYRSAAEISATQALRPIVGVVDTPQTRFLGDIDKVKRGERAIIYAGMQGTQCRRRAYVMKEAQAALGTEDFTIVADNGVKVIVDKNIKNGKRAYRKR